MAYLNHVVSIYHKDGKLYCYNFSDKKIYLKKIDNPKNEKLEKWAMRYSVSSVGLSLIAIVINRSYMSLANSTLNIFVFAVLSLFGLSILFKVNRYGSDRNAYINSVESTPVSLSLSEREKMFSESRMAYRGLLFFAMVVLLAVPVSLFIFFKYSVLFALIAGWICLILADLLLIHLTIFKTLRAIKEIERNWNE